MAQLKAKKLCSLKDKTIGLMGAKKAYPILFNTRFGIHTFFLKFPIDVLILDKDNKVVKVCKRLKPNRVFFWSPLFNRVLELPENTIEKNNIKAGDIINIIF